MEWSISSLVIVTETTLMAQRYSYTEKETLSLAGGSECSHSEKVSHKMEWEQDFLFQDALIKC